MISYNPFLNIFNGRYDNLNSYENLLANGLLPYPFFNNWHPYLINLPNMNLEHMPNIINTNTSTTVNTDRTNAFNTKFPSLFNLFRQPTQPTLFYDRESFLGRRLKRIQPFYNPQTHPLISTIFRHSLFK